MTPVQETGLFVLARGWVPVRVVAGGKVPMGGAGWQHLRPTRDDIMKWGKYANLGVLLGSASAWLTDIDLDCPEAIELAPYYLPSTWVFGRNKKPRSHWLYIVKDARSYQFKDADNKTLLEIRGETSEGPGAQTVIPPSFHADGEWIEWDPEYCDHAEGPREINIKDFVPMVAKLARATIYMHQGATLEEAIKKAAAHIPQPRRKFKDKAAERNVKIQKGATCAVCGVVAEEEQVWSTANVCSSECVMKLATEHLAKMPPSISGSGGRRQLFIAAQALVRGYGLDEETAFEMLKQDFSPRCQPAWKDKDIRRRVVAAANESRKENSYLLAVVK
jgi:hypothetical protein